jgi:TetR/AcrR family transcriptional regulator, repressor for uid operon
MSFATLTTAKRAADERRERILEAAESVFASHGFHAATMQHVAEAAGMSAGNLYRTFPSKEAIVEGLCARDQQERVASFLDLAETDSILEAVRGALREHLVLRGRRKAGLSVEIWAEAARNSSIADMLRAVDGDILGKIEHVVIIAKERGEAAPEADPAAIARMLFTYVSGLLKRIVLEPDFDAEAEAELAFQLLKSLCAGALAPVGTESSR